MSQPSRSDLRAVPTPASKCSSASLPSAELRHEADHKVQEREIFLERLRGLLFPPESTSSPESQGGATQGIAPPTGGKSGAFPVQLPSVLPPSTVSPRMFHGPSIREVQEAVVNLREASLCVVEAVQAWRRERLKTIQERRKDVTKVSPGRGSWDDDGGRVTLPQDASPVRPEYSGTFTSRDTTKMGESHEVRFPSVPTARSTTTSDDDLPIFWWVPTAGGERDTDSGLSPETFVPEQVVYDLNRDSQVSADVASNDHNYSGRTVASSTSAVNADTNRARASAANYYSPEERVPGVNYLARMATDTDFIGAPGSILADFLPPDTKLFRNPFVLGHNLDDTLAVFPGGSAQSPRDRHRYDGTDIGGSSSSSALKKGRLDMRRVRLAAEVIIAEDSRERAAALGKRPGSEDGRELGGPGGAPGDGDKDPNHFVAEIGSYERDIPPTPQDWQRFYRPESGGWRSADGDRGGRGNSNPRKGKEKDGITFQDLRSEEDPLGSNAGQTEELSRSIKKVGNPRQHPGKLKRSRKHKTMPDVRSADDTVGFRAADDATRPRSTAITKNSGYSRSEDGGDWTTITKAEKEPVYKGPWVPVMLDTNVSCPEGINEVLAEDDVSWQLKAGDRIRIGCCTGHEWEVKGVLVVPHGKGKCRIALTELYSHAKSMRLQHDPSSQLQDQNTQPAGGQGWSSQRAAGSGGRGGNDSAGPRNPRLVRTGTQGQILRHERNGLRTVSSHSNMKPVIAANSGKEPPSTAPATSLSTPALLTTPSRKPGVDPIVEKENNAGTSAPLGTPRPESPKTEAGGISSAASGSRNNQNSAMTPPTAAVAGGGEGRQPSSTPAADPADEVTDSSKPTAPPKSAQRKMKPPSSPRHGIAGSATPASATGVGPARKQRTAGSGTGSARLGRHRGRGGGGGRGNVYAAAVDAEVDEKRHAAKNLEIFEQNLAAMSLPKGVVGKGAGGGRRRSVQGGYKAHAEAVKAALKQNPERVAAGGTSRDPTDNGKAMAPAEHNRGRNDDNSNNSGSNRKSKSNTTSRESRRLSDAPPMSERMPGAELVRGRGGLSGGPDSAASGGGAGGGGGLARCQRVWKMVPQAKDHRPTWLRQYEDGMIPYGSHYQNPAGRGKTEVHFRVRISWARLELIVVDRPNTRKFTDFRPKQRYTYFRKLGIEDLLLIAYRETVAASGIPAGSEKSPAELDLKSWHNFVVALGFIADASQPARHHDIEQLYRQRTRQYRAELKKLEAIAAKARERILAEERAHARKVAASEARQATGDKNSRPKSPAGSRPGTGVSAPAAAPAAAAAAVAGSSRKTPEVSRSGSGKGPRTASRGQGAAGKARGEGPALGGAAADAAAAVDPPAGRKVPGSRGKRRTADSSGRAGTTGSRGETPKTGTRQGDGRQKAPKGGGVLSHGAAPGGSVAAPAESVRGHQQVVMKHVLDQDLRMDPAAFKDALTALVLLRQPDLERMGRTTEGLRDLVFNHLLVRPELEKVREMAWLQAKNAAIVAEAPFQCGATRIQAVWRGRRRLRIYRSQQRAALVLHTWIRMAVKRKQFLAELRRLEALRLAALRKAASTVIQTWFRRISWIWKFADVCEKRRQETLRKLREWRAAKRRKRRKREQAMVFRQSRDLNGCMVMISMSKKGERGLDMHVRAYVPVTQETFRFVIKEKDLHDQLCRALKTESLSGAEVLQNLELVAARLSCRKQRDGRRWVVSRAKRVAAESGNLAFRVARRLDGVLYFWKVYRSSTDVTVTAYEPKRCETLRVSLPIRGPRGISVWIRWEVEMATTRRKRELLRRLGEVQKILKLHEMNVEIERPKLLAARRLGEAFQQRQASLTALAKLAKARADDPSEDALVESGDARSGPLGGARSSKKRALVINVATKKVLPSAGVLVGATVPLPAAAAAVAVTEAPPTDAELTGMGPLPFAWYDGAVPDLDFFGDGVPLETDEVASAPDIDITARGREETLARWILRRVKVERIRVVETVLPGGNGGGRWTSGDAETKPRATRSVARWESVLVTFYEVETKRQHLAASRIQGLRRMKEARDRVRTRILTQFEKRFDVYSGKFYYHSNKTGVDTFIKPRLLLPDQDLEEPADEWIEKKDRFGKTFYTNPATGQRSHLSVPRAAAVIVKACRCYLQAFYGVPGADTIERGLRFSREAEAAWRQGGGRLASTLNYALVVHTHRLDFDAAGPLYDTALKLSGENPLVQRACGLFLISSCRFPRAESRSKGLALLTAANYRDSRLNTFALAEGAFYHFGLLCRPTHARALMNWALVLEHVRRDATQAELFYRRALAANDLDPLVLANYKSFCMERIPGGLYPGGGPGSRVLRRSRLDGQSSEWGEWKRYSDPEAKERCLAKFWFHPLRQETSWQGPIEEGAEGTLGVISAPTNHFSAIQNSS